MSDNDVWAADAQAVSVQSFAHVVTDQQQAIVNLTASRNQAVLRVDDLMAGTVHTQDLPANTTTVILPKLPAGYYQIHWQDQSCPLAVLVGPDARLGPSPVVAIDNNMTWQVSPTQWDDVAKLIATCGLQWVRERVSWARIEPKSQQWNWEKNDAPVDTLHNAGLKVIQAYHGTPKWAREDRWHKASADNLFDAYRFAKTYAQHYRGKVFAFEGWNEPNLQFFDQLPDQLAALQKAWYLGFKHGNPEMIVLAPAFTRMDPSYTRDQLYLSMYLANASGRYFDVMNYHHYGAVTNYDNLYQTVSKQLDQVGMTNTPSWSTESGTPIPIKGTKNISPYQQIHQATFLSQMFPSALASGEERVFWYVLTTWITPNSSWHSLLSITDEQAKVGVSSKQGPALPGLCALSNAAQMLGDGKYLGAMTGLPKNVVGHLFDRGNDTICMTLWNADSGEILVDLPLETKTVKQWRNFLGTPVEQNVSESLMIKLTKQAQYLILPKMILDGKMQWRPAKSQTPARTQSALTITKQLMRLVFPRQTIDDNTLCYRLDPNITNEIKLQIYNFDDKPFVGKLNVHNTDAWQITPAEQEIHIDPTSHLVIPLNIKALQGNSIPSEVKLALSDSQSQIMDVASVRLGSDLQLIKPLTSQNMDLANVKLWQKNMAPKGKMSVTLSSDDVVSFSFHFDPESRDSSWAFPQVRFVSPMNMQAYNAVRFALRAETKKVGPIHVQLVESDGTTYVNTKGTNANTQWKMVTVMFDQMTTTPSWPDKDNDQLDLDRISALRFGGEFKDKTLGFEIRDVQLLQLPH